MKRKIIPLMFFMCALIGANTYASLPVIYDSGLTQPIAKYLPERTERKPISNKKKLALLSKKKVKPYTLPIKTPSMTLGDVTSTPKDLRYLQRPLFLVGSDTTSQRWLRDMREELLSIGAVGLLIEAQNTQDVALMKEIAGTLGLVPASAEGFARQVGLTHYPILISKQGWEQ